ncbi:hypothetical protein C0992_013305, partial [Termitomyces sp. T32_za158]
SGETQSPKKSTVKNQRTSQTKPPKRNLLVETKLQEYLDHIATNQDISIVDLEREYKPSRRPDKTATNYEEEYNKVVSRLVRSFSLTQLRTIANLYEIDIPAKLPKWPTAATIVEHKWKWPSLTGIKQEKRDSEIIRECTFLLHIQAQGRRQGIKERYFELPAERLVTPDSLQQISRQSGVFTEDAGQGLIRMTYKDGDEAAIRLAERLTFRAASEFERSSPAPIYVSQNQVRPAPGQVFISQSTYSFYPFRPSQFRSQASKQTCLFRMRRMEDWFKSELRDELQNAGNPSEIAHVMDLSG